MNEGPNGRPQRYRYYANEGAELFNLVLLAVSEGLARRPSLLQSTVSTNTLRQVRRWSDDEQIILADKETFASMTTFGQELTDAALPALDRDSGYLNGRTAVDLLFENVEELKTYSDFGAFVDPEDYVAMFGLTEEQRMRTAIRKFMRDSFDFAFIVTMRTALKTLCEAPHTPSVMPAPEFWKALRSLLAHPDYVTHNVAPLASTGFAFLGNKFREVDASAIPLADASASMPVPTLSEWIETDNGPAPRVHKLNQHHLKRVMAEDGRGSRRPHLRNPNHDGTSSGCPVRHGLPRLPGGEDTGDKTGLNITIDICVRAIDEVLDCAAALRSDVARYGDPADIELL